MIEPLKVLVVEDEALILMQLEDLITDAGHLVVGTAMRRAEAITKAYEVHPDLALVDVSLAEGESGLDVAQALRGIENLLVVFVTANPLRVGPDFAGAAGVIAKPFSRAVMARGLAYLEECVRRPPPASAPPQGMAMAPQYLPG